MPKRNPEQPADKTDGNIETFASVFTAKAIEVEGGSKAEGVN